MVEGVAGFWIGAVLGVVVGLVVLDLVAGRLEEEGCGQLVEVLGWGVSMKGTHSGALRLA